MSEAAVVLKTALSSAQAKAAIERLWVNGLLELASARDGSAAYRALGLPAAQLRTTSDPPAQPLPVVPPESLDGIAGRFGLTPAEKNVLGLVGTGLSNEEIGERLFVSPATVRTHVYNLFKKLGVRSRVQAALLLSQGSARLDKS